MKRFLTMFCFVHLSMMTMGQYVEPKVLNTIDRITEKVTKDFEQWMVRGEFEKTVSYNQRMASRSVTVFDSLCELYVGLAIEEQEKTFSKWKMSYDADKEVFVFDNCESHNKDNFEVYRDLATMQIILAVPISMAPSFKERYDGRIRGEGCGQWKMRNGCLYPTRIVLFDDFTSDSITSIDLPAYKTTEIEINTSLLANVPSTLKGHVYRYSVVHPFVPQRPKSTVNPNAGIKGRIRDNDGEQSSIGLSNRCLRGSLPIPSYDSRKDGAVVVEIWVDRDGNVVDVKAPGKGSRNYDNAMVEAVKQAARKAHFSKDPNAPEKQKGTITYKFRREG